MEEKNRMLKKRNTLLQLKKRMADIREMHWGISNIFKNKSRKSYEYLEDFLEEISSLVEKLEVFPYHMIWECITQEVPGDPSINESYFLREVTGKGYKNAPIIKNDAFNYPRDKYFQVPLTRMEFSEKFLDYFKSGTLTKVFEIPLKPGYSYFNLPIFSENENMPQWLLTLIFKAGTIDLHNDPDFFEIMEHLSHQLGMAWDKFQENITAKLLEGIDYRLAGEEKTRSQSTLDHLKIISRILAGELQADWCGVFLVNEQKNTLKLETGNVDMEFRLNYSLTDHENIMVKCFSGNHIIRLLGRKNLEEIVKAGEMKRIEKGIRTAKKREIFKKGKRYFTPYELFEHVLFVPIAFGSKKPGLLTLFRAKKVQEPEPLDRFEYITRPFSQFETHLLQKIQRYVFNIFISHDAVQKRMRDIRKVIRPVSEAISSTKELTEGNTLPGKATVENLSEKLLYVNALSRIAAQYVRNFEILLDIDTKRIKLNREKISDLRKYLIDFARIYTQLIRPKCIHINITQQTSNNISIEVDRDFFDVVISNIFDNAIKYSFDPEDRILHGLQAKPISMEDKENILITADEDENSVIVTVSSYGINIMEAEKKKIFDREFRGFNAADRGEGTGSGLYLAKEIIELHEGTIRLVPGTPEHNTKFEIKLPKKGLKTERRRN